MVLSVEEAERFQRRYTTSGADVLLETEREVLGSDYQANGYTTRAQADELGRVLGLGATDRLLDIGAGCGWPGLYLAARHGCSLVSCDPVVEGLVAADERAARDRQREHLGSVVASGDAIPFRPRSFDAVVHTDVVC